MLIRVMSEVSDFDIFLVPSRRDIMRAAGPPINGSGGFLLRGGGGPLCDDDHPVVENAGGPLIPSILRQMGADVKIRAAVRDH